MHLQLSVPPLISALFYNFKCIQLSPYWLNSFLVYIVLLSCTNRDSSASYSLILMLFISFFLFYNLFVPLFLVMFNRSSEHALVSQWKNMILLH